ncbi:MAG: hypothetical protein ACI8WB_004704 [Phenylobacterium sp.]|jgi:hypothetical protein
MTKKDLIIIFGPPAVGKMTVGKALEAITGFKLFHNHMSNDLALRFFDYEDDAYSSLVESIREQVFKAFLKSDDKGLIFTFVWHLEDNYGANYIDSLERLGYRIHLVELKASMTALIQRNKSEQRLAEKPGKMNIIDSEKNLIEWTSTKRLNTNWHDTVPQRFDQYVFINNTSLSAHHAAAIVADTFNFATESNQNQFLPQLASG